MGRRRFLTLGATVLAAATIVGPGTRARAAPNAQAPWVLPDPALGTLVAGGGATYDSGVDRADADVVVSTKRELLRALRHAGNGDVVYVDDTAVIDMGSTDTVGITDGVTLASGRGTDGSPGALVYTDAHPTVLFKVYGDGVRLSGLRIRGPRSEYFEARNPVEYASRGVWLVGDDCEVDNCQLYGWPHAAVTVGAQRVPSSAHVHHNSIHHNQLERLGYGVDLLDGHSLVEYNHFDYNRHAIDGFGFDTNGYEARFNLVGPHTVSHAFDMHCLAENVPTPGDVPSDGDLVTGGAVTPPWNRAGGTIAVHHNAFQFTHDVFGRPQEAIAIRGVPAVGAAIEHNWFAHPTEPSDSDANVPGAAFRQRNLNAEGWQNLRAADNAFGVDYLPADLLNADSLCWIPGDGVE